MENYINLKEYEGNKPGEYSIIAINAEPGWELKVNIDANKNLFKQLYALVNKKYPYMYVLRLIIITSDVCNTYNQLIKSIEGKQEIVAPLSDNFIAGKSFCWGNINSDNLNDYHATIILNERFVAAALLYNDALGLGIAVHELTHVGEGVLEKLSLGINDVNTIKFDEWDRIKNSIARSINSEYRANMVAFQFLVEDETCLWERILESVEYLQSCKIFMSERYEDYLSHKNIYRFWLEIIDSIYRSFSALGRSFGFLKYCKDDKWKKYIGIIQSIDVGLVDIIIELRERLYAIDGEYEKDDFDKIATVVEKGFEKMGIKPFFNESGTFNVKILFEQ